MLSSSARLRFTGRRRACVTVSPTQGQCEHRTSTLRDSKPSTGQRTTQIRPVFLSKGWGPPHKTTPFSTEKILFGLNKIFFGQKKFYLRRTKSFFGKKCFVFDGQNLFCPKKVLFASDETFSGQTRLCPEESGRECLTKIFFSSERVSFGTDVAPLFRLEESRLLLNRLRLAGQIFGCRSRPFR